MTNVIASTGTILDIVHEPLFSMVTHFDVCSTGIHFDVTKLEFDVFVVMCGLVTIVVVVGGRIVVFVVVVGDLTNVVNSLNIVDVLIEG